MTERRRRGLPAALLGLLSYACAAVPPSAASADAAPAPSVAAEPPAASALPAAAAGGEILALTAAAGPSPAVAVTVSAAFEPPPGGLPVRPAGEAWAYVSQDELASFRANLPITDLAVFCAEIDSRAELVRVPDRARIKAPGVRVHLVLAEVSNFASTHFALNPDYPKRDKLVADLARAAAGYDGVQVDFEAVARRDLPSFYAFLRSLKSALGGKALSVAVPARTSKKEEYFDYEVVAGICDRVVVMAYDEHWSGSRAGPVASLPWCERVARFALGAVPAEKLVMGVPFYGRAWADKTHSRAYKHSGVAGLLREKDILSQGREGAVPAFRYRETVDVAVFYEDAASLMARISLYAGMGVGHVAFWRLGQEDPDFWAAYAAAPPAAGKPSAFAPGGPGGG